MTPSCPHGSLLTLLDSSNPLRRTGARYLEYLQQSVELPLLYVPYLFVRAHGRRVTRMVASALGEELGL